MNGPPPNWTNCMIERDERDMSKSPDVKLEWIKNNAWSGRLFDTRVGNLNNYNPVK